MTDGIPGDEIETREDAQRPLDRLVMCDHRIEVQDLGYHPGGTALRVEVYPALPRCKLKPKRKDIDVCRWILSGGSPIDVCHPCSAKCPLKVPADIGRYFTSFTGPCPVCRRIGKLSAPGNVKCKECGTEFELIDNT